MENADLEMFMEKLRWLVYENDNPLIEARKPEIQMLFEELSFLIGSGFRDSTIDEEQLHGVEDDVGNNWKKRIMEAAQVAEDTVDMFLSSSVIINDDSLFIIYSIFRHPCILREYSYKDLKYIREEISYNEKANSFQVLRHPYNLLDFSLKDLKYVMDDLKSIREEIMSSNNNNDKGNCSFQKQDKMMMMDFKFEATGGGSRGNNTRVNLSATEHKELIVGFDDDALLIMDRLTGHRKKLDIISIVGMGGLGKTTLATKIFNDSYVEYYFDIRGWVTVSQVYSLRDLLLQLLASIGKSVHEATSEPKLCERLCQSLKGRKYLIVIDDIWTCMAWEDVRLCFPNDNKGSRVLVTTRLTEVALHASQGGFTHNLGHLNEDQSWELLCRKTFKGYKCPYKCPVSLIETGKQIAKQCGGLPLALVVIAGLLEKGKKKIDLWVKVAESAGSYIINDPKGCLNTLALSYDHLPSHLKKCFLYVGGFPENYEIQVQRLIRLWMAEGFIKEADQRSLEEEGEDYLMGLIDRNLLIVAGKSSNGGVKSCRLHDLLRELCLKKACEENFFKKLSMPKSNSSSFSDSASSMMKQRRLFTDYEVLDKIYSHGSATYTRSVLCFHHNGLPESRTVSWVSSFLLLRVLDLLNIPKVDFTNIRILFHLRYLAVWSRSRDVFFSDANLRTLQTLIVKGNFQSFTYLPNIMLNLRHLECDRIAFPIDFHVNRLFNLQTISRLRLDHGVLCLLESFSNIKKLGCSIASTLSNLSFAMLTRLEALNIETYMHESLTLANPIRFPETLKKLTLKGLCLPWNCMSTIQRLPKLEVLKLLDSSFSGHLWEAGDESFHQLKFLKLEKLSISVWEASSINFPCLRKLVVTRCEDLKEIPLGLGNIYTLEHIVIDHLNCRLLKSISGIQEARREIGNYVNVTLMKAIDMPNEDHLT